ncbi:MAG: GGDEF domain-containing protein [Gammaproteobacteria bacterium]|nr:GGDEF domain-containing protein [Gammaproteobacteria bacterium]
MDQDKAIDNNTLLEADEPAKAAEYLRLTMAKLTELQLPFTPVYYGLFYIYIAGKNTTLNRKVERHIENKTLTHENAVKLFVNFFFVCSEELTEGLRNELLDTITEVVSSIIDIAGKSSISNKQLEKHIDTLSSTQSTQNVLSVVSSIVHVTRQFVDDTKQLETNLLVTSKGLNTLKNELAHARIEATTDSLTGLLNRRGFDEQLKRLLNDRRKSGAGFCIIMADIDHFKDLNDSYGHLFGDKILQVFARLLTEKTRSTDYVARFGGEEFIIILPETSMENAFMVAENIRKAVEKLQVRNTKSGDIINAITSSFGIAAHRFDESGNDIVDRCDTALYKAKQNGRNKTIKS